MLSESKNADWYAEWYSAIEDTDVQDAYCYLVGLASTLNGYTCRPGKHGYMKDFRFYCTNDEKLQPFAFSVNKHSLLFYFRSPAVKSGHYNFSDIAAISDEATDNGKEWSVPILSITDVKKLDSLTPSPFSAAFFSKVSIAVSD